MSLADAIAHDLFHRDRGDRDDRELAERPRLMTVGHPPRLVEDDCPLCGRRGPVLLEDGRCAVAAGVLIRALGGSLADDGERLVIRLPASVS